MESKVGLLMMALGDGNRQDVRAFTHPTKSTELGSQHGVTFHEVQWLFLFDVFSSLVVLVVHRDCHFCFAARAHVCSGYCSITLVVVHGVRIQDSIVLLELTEK